MPGERSGPFERLGPADPRLVPYRGLTDSGLRRQLEPAAGIFIVEGRLALHAVLESGYPLVSVLVLEGRQESLAGLGLPPGVPVYVVDGDVMASTTGFDVHRGVLALAGRLPPVPALQLVDELVPRLMVVVEGVNDQENLGAIFRNAAAFGAGAVLLGPTCCDPLYRRTVRVSLGNVLKAHFARLTPWPSGLLDLKEKGYQLLALTPRPAAAALDDVATSLQGARAVVVVGAEGPGLSSEVIEMCEPVRIPMAPGVDSLNVAAATAVALYRLAGLV